MWRQGSFALLRCFFLWMAPLSKCWWSPDSIDFSIWISDDGFISCVNIQVALRLLSSPKCPTGGFRGVTWANLKWRGMWRRRWKISLHSLPKICDKKVFFLVCNNKLFTKRRQWKIFLPSTAKIFDPKVLFFATIKIL